MAEDEHREAELPLESVGARLRRTRELKGLGRADVAALTRIAERHLTAIEEDRFSDLASSTYAVGFSRAYARAVGLDEHAIANDVRAALAGTRRGDDRGLIENFEPGDPARVPAARTAWVAALAGLVVVGLLFLLWRSYLAPAASLPELRAVPAAVTANMTPGQAGPGAVPAGEEVVFTATQAGVWVKFYDASGAQLMQKQMALGESYVVPADAEGPMIWTARPEALDVRVGARRVPPLADRQMTIKDVPVSAAALLARVAVASPALPSAVQASPGLPDSGADTAISARTTPTRTPPPSSPVSASAAGSREATTTSPTVAVSEAPAEDESSTVSE